MGEGIGNDGTRRYDHEFLNPIGDRQCQLILAKLLKKSIYLFF